MVNSLLVLKFLKRPLASYMVPKQGLAQPPLVPSLPWIKWQWRVGIWCCSIILSIACKEPLSELHMAFAPHSCNLWRQKCSNNARGFSNTLPFNRWGSYASPHLTVAIITKHSLAPLLKAISTIAYAIMSYYCSIHFLLYPTELAKNTNLNGQMWFVKYRLNDLPLDFP